MTAGFQPSVEGCHHVIAGNGTIKCSTMKPGVFSCVLEEPPPKELSV